MPRSNTTSKTIPFPVEAALKRLGANIALARKRRRLRQSELAAKAGITHVTLRRIERGSPTSAIGAYFTLLWALGLEAEFRDIASPDRDEVGKQAERARTPRRARPSASVFSDEF
ncbi:MAG TPA: helix-turn-helix domain-containing protein [Casimicrobiaceae bacterium]